MYGKFLRTANVHWWDDTSNLSHPHGNVTTYGVVNGSHKSIVHSEVKMDDLFNS